MRTFSDFLQIVGLGAAMTAPLVGCAFLATYLIEAARGRFRNSRPFFPPPWLWAILTVVLGIPLGWAMQGSFFGVALPYFTVVMVIAPCLVLLSIIALVFGICTRRVPRTLWIGMLLLAACAPALALSYGLNVGMNQWEVDSARAYVARAMPVLDGIKKETGAYPDTLPVSVLGTPPKLLRAKDGYTTDGKVFHFYYPEPGALLSDGPNLDSNSRVWINEPFVD